MYKLLYYITEKLSPPRGKQIIYPQITLLYIENITLPIKRNLEKLTQKIYRNRILKSTKRPGHVWYCWWGSPLAVWSS